MLKARRDLIWEAEGREVSLGLTDANGLAFVINGKIDGNAKLDSPTHVMLGMVSAALHPAPQKAMVIGLGTGSSAGWLAEIDSITRVDVAELEPDILEVARRCAPVNRNVLSNPKVRTIIADAREVLLTSPEQYDLIVSEPSNPFRAGVASLYTPVYPRVLSGCNPTTGPWRDILTVDSGIRDQYPDGAYHLRHTGFGLSAGGDLADHGKGSAGSMFTGAPKLFGATTSLPFGIGTVSYGPAGIMGCYRSGRFSVSFCGPAVLDTNGGK